ncbi:MAG: signal peptidase II [Eubacteriales bacterium]
MVQAVTLLVIVLLTCADQLIKFEILKHLEPVGSVMLIRGFIHLRYVENTGAIFGSMQSKTIVLTILTAVIITVALFALLLKKIKPGFLYGCLVLVISGGIGNLIDRVFRGFVVDYIEPLFVNFAIFNFADCLVTVGAFAMMGYLVFDIIKDFRKAKDGKH